MKEETNNSNKIFLIKEDLLSLELMKNKILLSKSTIDKAMVENDLAEIKYKYLILQLYRKYNLSDEDQITPSGEIIKNEK